MPDLFGRTARTLLVVLLCALATKASAGTLNGNCLESSFDLKGQMAKTVFVAAPFKGVNTKGNDPIDLETDVDVTSMPLPVIEICREKDGPTVNISGVRFNKEKWEYQMYWMGTVGLRPNRTPCLTVKSPRVDLYSTQAASGTVRICW